MGKFGVIQKWCSVLVWTREILVGGGGSPNSTHKNTPYRLDKLHSAFSRSAAKNRVLHFYRPQMKFGQGYVFTDVCHSFCQQRGWLPSMHHRSHDWGRGLHPREVRQTPPPNRDTWDTTRYVQQAGSTHPTGMHSCVQYARQYVQAGCKVCSHQGKVSHWNRCGLDVLALNFTWHDQVLYLCSNYLNQNTSVFESKIVNKTQFKAYSHYSLRF